MLKHVMCVSIKKRKKERNRALCGNLYRLTDRPSQLRIMHSLCFYLYVCKCDCKRLWLWVCQPFSLVLCSCRSEWCNWDLLFPIRFAELQSIFRCSGSHVFRVSYALLPRRTCGCVASLMLCVELASVMIDEKSD